jgi:hypothetical protein
MPRHLYMSFNSVSHQYIRAFYNEDRGSYVSANADWIEGEPSVEYRFTLQEHEENPHSWEGGLEKFWIDEEGSHYGEFFVFAEYDNEAAFDADVGQILRAAREVSVKENIDEFLAVTDIVKRKAVALAYEDEVIEDLEGLFQDGPEDAYTLCDLGDSPRLHHHVDCEDECWFLHVASVTDTEKQALGWGLFAVHLPDLASTASEADIKGANRARILLLDHLQTKRDAQLAKHGFVHYMETERVDSPEYAYMNDTEVLEGAAIDAEWDDATNTVVWQEYDGKALQDFLNENVLYALPCEKWQPREESLVDRLFKEHPQPTWLEDQLRAALDDQAGVEPDEDEDSPWQNLDLD